MKKTKTFAQRAKEIEKKFEGRNDKISLRTKKSLMQDLRDEQEIVKAQLKSQEDPSLSLDDYSDTNQAFLGDLFSKAGAGTPGITPEAGVEGAAGGGASFGLNNVTDLISGAQGIFGKSKVDDSGLNRPDVPGMEKANITNAVSGGLDSASKFATGDFIGGATGLVKTVGGIFGGKKDLKAANEALANNDQALANNYRPNSYMAAYGGYLKRNNPYSNGGIINSDPNTESKWEPIPQEDDSNEIPYNRRLEAWGNRMKLTPEQLQAFVSQKESDNQWTSNRDTYYADQFSTWRSGMTGQTPNSKLTQTDPLYKKFWDTTKSTWHKDNPRPINDIVSQYRKSKLSNKFNDIPKNSTLAAQDSGEYAYGGKVNKYANGGDILKPINELLKSSGLIDVLTGEPLEENRYNTGSSSINKGNANLDLSQLASEANKKININNNTGIETDEKSKAGVALDWLGKNSGDILQYAPALGALTNKIGRPVTPRGTRIEGDVSLGRYDERRLLKEIRNSQDVAGTAKEGSGGNLSLYNRLAQTGSLNKIKGISKAYQAMADSNLNQETKETQFNEQRKFANMAADERFLEREAADKGAYETAKQQNRAAIFENIGNVAREEVDKKTVKEMYGYKWNGKYWTDPKGNRVSDTEYKALLEKNKKQMANMFGGYLKK